MCLPLVLLVVNGAGKGRMLKSFCNPPKVEIFGRKVYVYVDKDEIHIANFSDEILPTYTNETSLMRWLGLWRES